MSTSRPDICDHPLIQADDLRFYLANRLRAGNVDLYSAFLLAHEAVRIGRHGYLQSAWGYTLSISGLLRLFVHALTARAFRADALAAICDEWLTHDVLHLMEHRPHFFTDRLSDLRGLAGDASFLELLSEMREQCDTLHEDNGPFHLDVFPWHYAAPEREVLMPGSQHEFHHDGSVDTEVAELIGELCGGYWA